MDEQQKLLEELKSTVASALDPVREEFAEQLKTHGEATAETKQELEKIQDRLDAIEIAAQKAALDTPRRDGEKSDESKAFDMYARKGVLDAEVLETKVLREAEDVDGGYLVPDDYVAELIKGVTEYSPLRELARVRTTVRQSVKAPKRTQAATASWVAESGTRSETTNPQFGLEEIPTHELYALADVTRADLEDSAFDLEDYLFGQEFAEAFGVAEGTALISGTGIGRPEGILENADVASTTSTTNDVLDSRDFAKLLYALKEPYHANATWLMHRTTVRDARLIRDTTENFIWQPGLAGATPATILDRPYRMAADMPAVANGAKAVVIGDFRKAYWLVDRILIAVQRDPYTQAGSGAVRFHAWKRLGGQVVVPEAIKLLTIQ